MVIFFLKEKSEAIIYLKQLFTMIQQELQVDIQRIKTDLGGEFNSKQFQDYTQEKGIIHEFSAAYTSEQNGYIERNNRTIVEATRSMLHSRNLPLNLWAEAANTAVFVWNRTINKHHPHATPYEQLFNQVPDVSFLRTFGSDAYLHVPKPQRKKLDPKSQKLIFVGYDQRGRAYILWNPSTKRICVGVDVIIHETLGFQTDKPLTTSTQSYSGINTITIPICTTVPAAPTSTENLNISVPLLSDESHHAQNEDAFDLPQTEQDAQSDTNSDQQLNRESADISNQGEHNENTSNQGEDDIEAQVHIQEEDDETRIHDEAEIILPEEHHSQSDTSAGTSSTGSTSLETTQAETNSEGEDIAFRLRPRSRQPPSRYGDWIKYDDNRSNTGSAAYIAKRSQRIPEPKTYKEAMKSSHATEWKNAMAKEYASLIANKTWVLKPLPEGRKAVKCKWIYKVKCKPSGEVECFKARLVAKGFSQVAGIDYTETYAPVIKYDAVRAVFVISNEHGMFKAQFDVCTAYLNANLLDIIFMEQPEGFEDHEWPLYVCLLLKSLYGLKQSARRWNKTFDKFAQQFALIPNIADPCVYYSTNTTHPNKIETILGIFVDDGIVCSTDPTKLEDIL